MATTPSLFGGISGGMDEATMQRQLDAQRAAEVAQLTPNQMYAQMAYQGGAGLTRGIGGMLGADTTDPMIKQATQIRQLASQFDTNTPEGMAKFAEALRPLNPEASLKAAQQAQTMQMEQAKLGTEKASAAAKMAEKTTTEQKNAAAKADTSGAERGTPEWAAAYKTALNELLTKPEKALAQSEIGKLLAERNQLDPVKDKAQIAIYDAKIKKLTTGGGIGSEIAAGLSPVLGAIVSGQTKAASTELGKEAGKQIANIEGKYEAGYAISDALDLLGKGIYAGGYAPMEETIAKYGMGILGDKKRLANTQSFKAYLAEVVIPRLKDFGGSDTIEELKYLQSASGANTDVEPKALEQILQRAQKKINRGVEKLQRQNTELQGGKPLSITPVGETKKATRRYNLQTKQFETIGQ